jgi:hypothetical protein
MAVLSIAGGGSATIDANTPASSYSDGIRLNTGLVGGGSTLNINGVSIDAPSLANVALLGNNTINLDGGGLTTGGLAGINLLTTTTFNLNNGSELTFGPQVNLGLLNSTTINMGAGDNTLNFQSLDLNLLSSLSIQNFSAGDSISVAGAADASYNETTGFLTFTGASGLPIGSVNVGTGLDAESFAFQDGAAVYPCFLRGTLLMTPRGPVAIEALEVGDEVTTMRQGAARVKWLGHRTVDPATVRNPAKAMPVRIRAGALGENLPQRDLLVSPDHCLFFEGRLFTADRLVNGTSIVQETMSEPFQYFHVEFEEHDVVFAEGAAAESYLDTGNRTALYGSTVARVSFGKRGKSWKDSCYPLTFSGPVLVKLRALVAERAEALGLAEPEAVALAS